MADKNIEHRLTSLEINLKEAEKDIETLTKKVSYYDRLAIRWGGFIMAIMTLASIGTMGFDGMKSKLIQWFHQ